jgi:hypothetical protein
MKVMQDLLAKSGLNSDAIAKAMPQLEEQNADKASIEGLEKTRMVFNRKQEIINMNVSNALKVLKNEDFGDNMLENVAHLMPNRPGVAAYTRDLHVF